MHSKFSSYNSFVDIAAPGENIYSCIPVSDYTYMSGTSMSTPIVSATAAILYSMSSQETNFSLDVDDIETILCNTATDISPSGKDIYTGSGLLNLNLAVQVAKKRFINNSAPQNMVATAKNYQAITLRWKGVTWAEQYVVYRSTEVNGTYNKIKHIDSNDPNHAGVPWYFTDTGCDTGTTYYYKVRAASSLKDAFSYSGFSTIVSAKCILNTPSGLSLSASSGKITASWDKVAGATGYRVFRATSKAGTYTRIKNITNAATLSYADTSVVPGKTYYYKIRAYRTVNGKDILSDFSIIVGKKAL